MTTNMAVVPVEPTEARLAAARAEAFAIVREAAPNEPGLTPEEAVQTDKHSARIWAAMCEAGAGWFFWSGGGNPVGRNDVVEARRRDGSVVTKAAFKFDWLHSPRRDHAADIVAYRLAHQAPVSPAEGGETDWIEWAGGENPAPGQRVDYLLDEDGDFFAGELSDDLDWSAAVDIHSEAIIAYRVVPTPPADRGIG